MSAIRLIARLDIKGPNLIKGVHLEGLRVLGKPNDFAKRYYEQGVDEILYMDSVASLYGRNNLSDIVKQTAREIFVPITVGGGIRSIADAKQLLRSGADKIAVNTAAITRPDLITELANDFGSQCVVLSIEAIRQANSWHAYTDNGREKTGLDVIDWVKQGVALGAGEVLLTSIDQEGTRQGFDVALVREVSQAVNVPIITSGGMGSVEHLLEVVKIGGTDAVAMADVLHYDRLTLNAIRQAALIAGITARCV